MASRLCNTSEYVEYIGILSPYPSYTYPAVKYNEPTVTLRDLQVISVLSIQEELQRLDRELQQAAVRGPRHAETVTTGQKWKLCDNRHDTYMVYDECVLNIIKTFPRGWSMKCQCTNLQWHITTTMTGNNIWMCSFHVNIIYVWDTWFD